MLVKPHFRMFVKPGCPFCQKAEDLIVNNIKLTVSVEDVTNKNTLRNELIEETGIKTVPIIYLGDTLIGGCSDLEEAILNGKMEVLLLKEEIRMLKSEIATLLRRM